MTERRWSEIESHLRQQVQDFRLLLSQRGIHVALDPGASLVEQMMQLEQAVRGYLTTCRNEVETMRRRETVQQESEKQLKRFIENAPVAIAMFDTQMRYLAVSQRWMRDYALHGDIIGRSHYDIFPEIPERWKVVHRRVLAGETLRATDDRFARADGSVQWLRWEVRPWYEQDGVIGGVVMFTEDITDLKTIQEALQRQNRALRMLSAVNEALVRATTETELLQHVCRVTVEAGYHMAWVGLTEYDPAKTVRPVAAAGEHIDFITRHAFSWDAARPEGQGPLGQAIRARLPVFADDFRTAPAYNPWREDALARNFRSGIALPLIAHDEPLGVLVLYRTEPYAYTANECTLLMELADDLAFGMVTQRTRSARRQAEEALQQSETRYRRIVETAQEGIMILNQDMQITFANQHLASMLGYPIDGLHARSLYDLIPSELRAEMDAHIEKRRQGIREVYEFLFHRADGSDIWMQVSGSPMFDEQRRFAGTFAMLTDITDRHNAEVYQREFLRRTIEAATEGKLIISSREAIERVAGPTSACWDIRTSADLEVIRHGVTDLALAAGMEADRASDFILCVSEAITNACKHAGGGRCSLHRFGDTLFVEVADNGPGILAINLPELALRRGYTTAVSLGVGYKAMISLADKIYLATGPHGTIVGIQMTIHPLPETSPVFPGVSEDW